jgi:hypothetical protein
VAVVDEAAATLVFQQPPDFEKAVAERRSVLPVEVLNAEPSNIKAKHCGQVTVARRAQQYEHRAACGSATAPQLGQ